MNVTEVNDTPTADPQTVTTSEEADVTITLSGSDNDPEVVQTLSFMIRTLPADGLLYQRASDGSRGAPIFNPDTMVSDALGRVIFEPDTNENGSPYTSFQFIVIDNGTTAGVADPKSSSTVAVTVNVTEVNDTPTANAQSVTGAEDTDLTITLTGNDGDPEATQNLAFTITFLPTNGQLYQRAVGGGRGGSDHRHRHARSAIRWAGSSSRRTPNENSSPYTTFQFTATDNGTTNGVADPKTSTAATVTVNVTEVNDTPTASAQSVSTSEDTDVTVTLTGADGDPE